MHAPLSPSLFTHIQHTRLKEEISEVPHVWGCNGPPKPMGVPTNNNKTSERRKKRIMNDAAILAPDAHRGMHMQKAHSKVPSKR